MKNTCLLLMTLTMFASAAVQADKMGKEREAKQAKLDAACEAARQTKLVVARAEHVEECVETKLLADRETCERFYADYGESAANQAPLFMTCLRAKQHMSTEPVIEIPANDYR